MRVDKPLIFAGTVLALFVLAGCGNPEGQPASLAEQRAAMHPAPPSADALKSEMAKVHFKTPGANVQVPPSGQNVPSTGK
jgi:uncharacterized protein YcfL